MIALAVSIFALAVAVSAFAYVVAGYHKRTGGWLP